MQLTSSSLGSYFPRSWLWLSNSPRSSRRLASHHARLRECRCLVSDISFVPSSRVLFPDYTDDMRIVMLVQVYAFRFSRETGLEKNKVSIKKDSLLPLIYEDPLPISFFLSKNIHENHCVCWPLAQSLLPCHRGKWERGEIITRKRLQSAA